LIHLELSSRFKLRLKSGLSSEDLWTCMRCEWLISTRVISSLS
jgi:hypothetical protein